MATPFLGEIKMFGGNFAPRNYAFCNGQMMSISQNTALFSILGTTYGGNGVNTFGLPDLQGRTPIHWGQGLGLSNYVIGEVGGTESVTLTQQQMPAHSHVLNAVAGAGTAGGPASNELLAASTARDRIYSTAAADTQLSPNAIGVSGSNFPVPIVQPFLTVSFIIALAGVFPSRN